MIYYRRYVSDYLGDTARLSMLEHGAYTVMLDYYYVEERPLPADLDELYRMVRAILPEERRAVQKVLAAYFERRADGYHNARADHEIAVSRQARENGSKGGRPRVGDDHDDDPGQGGGSETGSETGQESEKGAGSGHPSTFNLQPLAVSPQPSTVNRQKTAAAARRAAGESKTGPTEAAYAEAYRQRYRVEPLVNAKVRGMLARFVDRVPRAEAPDVAAFYVRSNRQLYVAARHCVDLLLRDAEGLRTEWATGRAGTETEARQADRTAATGAAFHDLLNEARRA
jgi:uncharacterized protein YdaU (DUF1376 family)